VINPLPSSFLIASRFCEVALVAFLQDCCCFVVVGAAFGAAFGASFGTSVSAFDDGLFWGFGVFCVGFAAVLVAADIAQAHVCTFLYLYIIAFTSSSQLLRHLTESPAEIYQQSSSKVMSCLVCKPSGALDPAVLPEHILGKCIYHCNDVCSVP